MIRHAPSAVQTSRRKAFVADEMALDISAEDYRDLRVLGEFGRLLCLISAFALLGLEPPVSTRYG